MNKMMIKKKEKHLMKFVQDFQINITEDDMFNLLKIKRRWPARTHTHDQPTIEVISMYGPIITQHKMINNQLLKSSLCMDKNIII